MADQVGFIGGGQMATALATGAIGAGFLSEVSLVFAEPDVNQQSRLREAFPEATIVKHGEELVPDCERIILAVKPHILRSIAPDLRPGISRDNLLVSIAAGISLASLKAMFDHDRVIRVMPNTPCQVGAGASAISADETTSSQDVLWVEELLNSVGETVRLPDHLIHAFTGIAGSSPAYLYLIIEALSDGGVAKGLPRNVATQMAAQAVLGAAKMVLDTGLHPGQLKDQVTSPGGTTIDALRELESSGLRSAVIEAVCRCTEKSQSFE